MEEPSLILQKREMELNEILHFGAEILLNISGEKLNENYVASDGFILKHIVMKNHLISSEDFSASIFRMIPPFTLDVQNKLKKTLNVDIQLSYYFNIKRNNCLLDRD